MPLVFVHLHLVTNLSLVSLHGTFPDHTTYLSCIFSLYLGEIVTFMSVIKAIVFLNSKLALPFHHNKFHPWVFFCLATIYCIGPVSNYNGKLSWLALMITRKVIPAKEKHFCGSSQLNMINTEIRKEESCEGQHGETIAEPTSRKCWKIRILAFFSLSCYLGQKWFQVRWSSCTPGFRNIFASFTFPCLFTSQAIFLMTHLPPLISLHQLPLFPIQKKIFLLCHFPPCIQTARNAGRFA